MRSSKKEKMGKLVNSLGQFWAVGNDPEEMREFIEF